jgi:hypothetical protein
MLLSTLFSAHPPPPPPSPRRAGSHASVVSSSLLLPCTLPPHAPRPTRLAQNSWPRKDPWILLLRSRRRELLQHHPRLRQSSEEDLAAYHVLLPLCSPKIGFPYFRTVGIPFQLLAAAHHELPDLHLQAGLQVNMHGICSYCQELQVILTLEVLTSQ